MFLADGEDKLPFEEFSLTADARQDKLGGVLAVAHGPRATPMHGKCGMCFARRNICTHCNESISLA
jgi:hypothetical protein